MELIIFVVGCLVVSIVPVQLLLLLNVVLLKDSKKTVQRKMYKKVLIIKKCKERERSSRDGPR